MGLGLFDGKLKVRDEGIALCFEGASETEVRETYERLACKLPPLEELATRFPMKTQEKYDGFLSEELQAKVFAQNALDLQGAVKLLSNLTAGR